MKEFTILLLVLVAVTSIPQVTNAQDTSLGSRLLKNTISSTSKVIRFKSNSFIRYGFNELPREMVERADTESISLQFITRAPDGLLWIYKSNRGQKMHISLENGQLVFVHDSGRGAPQRVVVPHPDGRALNDFNWHTVRVDKEGRKLNFFIDDQQSSAQMNTDSDVQFIASGAEVFLGGIKSPSTETAGVVDTNFDGALTDVETTKIMGPNREIIISFLQYIGDTEGDIEVIDPDDWNDGKFKWGTTRPPPTTQAPIQPTPVTFKTGSSVFYLRDPVDMRSGGSINFRFRTLEPRGLIAIARGSAQSVQFFAIEVFDGLLYFVYDLGSVTSRKLFSDRRVDDGEWHEVRMNVDGNSLTLSLDGRQFSVALSQNDVRRLYFYRMYFGGYDDYSRAPWPLYSRRGFKGCMETLQINEIGYDLHVFIRNQNLQGVEIGCRTMARFCQTQPCISGYCRDRMEGYVCSCADTPYTGRNCDLNAPVAGWDGTYSTIFSFLNREVTHTNDLSFRFNTPLRNTILFRTEADNTEDFIQAELVDGRVKVTMNVDGKTKTFFTGENLNDYVWHDLNIRRRADDIEVWVDNEPKMAGVIGGENFKLIIDRIKFGSFENGGNYIGYMQNFIYDNQELFTELKQQSPNQPWLINFPFNKLPTPTYKPVTIPTSEAFVQLPSMRMGLMMKILFKFKTKESNGLIMYNGGIGSDAIAIELSNGQIRLDYNLGGSNSFTIVPTAHMLNDNKWHTVRVSLNDRGQFNVMVDDNNADVTSSDGDNRLSLSGMLYMGGLPAQMYTRPNIASLISSTKGFRGCLASVDLNGAVPDLINYSSDRTQISKGCSELGMACKPDACGLGVCTSGLNDYWCDCNMTGYTGIPCNDFPNGYYFSKQGNAGIIMYEFPYEYQQNSNEDNIAFGFMTEEENGVLYRVESSLGQDFIEIRMENGYIIAESNTGSGLKSLIEKSRKFNDGQYHVVRYIRMGNMSTLQVGALPKQSITHTGQSTLFSKVYRVIIGGRVDSNGAQRMNFNGIIGGAYYNQHRWMDLLLAKKMLHTKLVKIQGDVVLARPFLLVKGGTKTTAAPPDIVIPPGGVIPEDIGGGGVIGGGIGGSGGVPPSVIGIGGPGGIETGPTGVGVDVIAGPAPLASGLVGGPPPVSGARAGAVVGTVLGTLGFLSSLMWALYKLKPGVPTCLSPGAGKAGSGAGMSISSPRATSNLAAVQAASAPPVKPAAVNGSPAGGGSSTYTSYFQSTSTAVGGGGGAGGGGAMNASSNAAGMSSSGGMASTAMVADEMDSSTLRTGGTNKRNMASSSSYSSNYQSSNTANYQSNNASNNYQSNNASNNYQSNTMQSYGSGGGSAGGGGTIDRSYDRQYMASSSGGDNIPDYDMPMPGTMQSGQSYSSSTLNTHYNYQTIGSSHSSRCVTVERPSQKSHTSVLNIIMNHGQYFPVKPRSDVYSSAFAPSRDQGFVDRAEDMVIEQTIPTLRVRPAQSIDSMTSRSVTDVTLHTDGAAPFASFSNQSHASQHSLSTDLTLTTDMGSSSSTRKSSLQFTPNPGHGRSGYLRLESSSSETNVNTLPGSVTSRGKKSTKHLAESCDNMYESTTTMMSDIQSMSMDNSLYSLNEEPNSNMPVYLELEAASGTTTTDHDYLYAKVQKDKRSQLSHDSFTKQNVDLESNWSASTKTGSQLTRDSVAKQNTGLVANLTQPIQTDIKSTTSTTYSVTCSAQLNDANHPNMDNTGTGVDTERVGVHDMGIDLTKGNRDTAAENIQVGSVREQTNASDDNAKSEISFEDTIKAFENFADLSLDFDTDQVTEQELTTLTVATGPVGNARNAKEHQTERSENLIEYTAPSISKPKRRTSKSKTATSSTNVIDIKSEYAATAGDDNSCETSFTIINESYESGSYKSSASSFHHEVDHIQNTQHFGDHNIQTDGAVGFQLQTTTWNENNGKLDEHKTDGTTRSTPIQVRFETGLPITTTTSGNNGDVLVTETSETSLGIDYDAVLNDSMNQLLTGINVDTSKWAQANANVRRMSDEVDVSDTFKVQNLKTVTMNKQGQYVMSSAVGGGAVTPGAAADEVRVDCCLMTSDGRSVVTGSSLGPPQVWDMQNGELQNIMKGDTIGSTNLHLVCGDRLLVGAVHSDMEINEYSSRKGVFNHTLQIWDFMTGRPLSMAEGEYCSALCPMSDSDKVLFGRTDKFGDATSIIAWDLMGNQMIKEMRYDAPVGNNDYISYLNKSKNDRYIVAGFTNSFDNQAEFMTFDMTLTSYNISEPAMLKLDANPDVSAILPKEEVVTGLRNGDLVIWNMRTAQPSRQLLGSGGTHAHTKEVKCVALSDDSRYLVSGSADGTLKVWDMHTERPIYTLQGHTDEVCCTSISSDNEIVVSGSADGTIRLWRTKNGSEMCVFNCGVDIFNVHMSHDKGTIVALGDKYGARKLIMLQVVRTKIKKIVSS